MGDLAGSVRVRLVGATVGVLAVALGLGGWALLRSVEGSQQSRLRAEVERRLDVVADRLSEGAGLQAALEAAGPIGLVQLVDPTTGDVLYAGSPGVAAVGHRAIPFSAPLPDPGEQVAARVTDASVGGLAIELETITRTIRTPRGTVAVVAAAPSDEVTRSVAAVRRALFVGLPLLLQLSTAAAWALVGRALRPVEAIRREAEAITGSTLHRRVPEPAVGDEVGRLARTMNGMLDRLEEASQRQREFVSDASHELRSPVATLRTELEVALAAADDTELRAAVERALTSEARLEALLADLLLLASVEESATTGPLEEVALDEVVAADAGRRPDQPVRVVVRGPSPADGSAVVAGRRLQLERVVANLVDNAARHAAGTVHVGVEVDADRREVVLAVDDDGPGIPVADRERVFERFTRLDGGRARADGGAGIGLALVRTIVRRHGGSARVADGPLGGARLEVRLPAAT